MQQDHEAAAKGLEEAMALLNQQAEQLAGFEQENQSLQQAVAAALAAFTAWSAVP